MDDSAALYLSGREDWFILTQETEALCMCSSLAPHARETFPPAATVTLLGLLDHWSCPNAKKKEKSDN